MHVNPAAFEILSALSLDTVLEYRTVASRIEDVGLLLECWF